MLRRRSRPEGRERQDHDPAKFPEGTKVLIEEQVTREELDLELDEEDKRAIDRALESIRQGKSIPGEVVRAILRRM